MESVSLGDLMLRKNGAGSDQYYLRIVNPPTHPGGHHAPMPQYFVLQDQRLLERVPRPLHLSPPYESITPIMFGVNGYPGVLVMDILRDRVIIDNANDLVLDGLGFRSTVISFEWPGYDTRYSGGDSMRSRIDVRPGGRPITRQSLAREICGLLLNFHKVVSKYPIAPGWERWALTAGPEGIRPSGIVLFSLHYYRNVWVPELYVVE